MAANFIALIVSADEIPASFCRLVGNSFPKASNSRCGLHFNLSRSNIHNKFYTNRKFSPKEAFSPVQVNYSDYSTGCLLGNKVASA